MNIDPTEHPQVQAHLVLLCFTLLHFTDTALWVSWFCFIFVFVFLQIKILWQPRVKQVCAIFPTAFVDFMSLCHILVILTIFQNFSLLFCLLW